MPIVNINEVKRYLDVSEPIDDLMLEECIARAQALLEQNTGRYLDSVKETRFFQAPKYGGATLMLDNDLMNLIRVVNGDGEEISPYDVIYEPINGWPKYAIELRASAETAWVSDDALISVRGEWAWIDKHKQPTYRYQGAKQAVIRLTSYLYKQRDSQVFETTAFMDGGVLTIPQGMPKSVLDWIDGNRRYV